MFNSDVAARLEVAVGLVNDLGVGPDLSRAVEHDPPHDVFRDQGYSSPTDPDDWAALVELAAATADLLRMVADRRHGEAVAVVNQWLVRHAVVPHLEAVERPAAAGPSWVVHFHNPGATFADGWAGGIGAALAMTYARGDQDRIKACAAAPCARLFVDRGRNQHRRFCGLRCQNRVKSAAYRRARRAGT